MIDAVAVAAGTVEVTPEVEVADSGTVTVGGAFVAVDDGVSVGKLGTIVTPGTGVRVGTLGTQSFCPT